MLSSTRTALLADLDRLRSRLTGGRAGRALAGLSVDYVGTAANVLQSFLLTPLMLALLSAPLYGFWLTIVQITTFMLLVDGGMGVYLMKAIAGAGAEADPKPLAEVIATTFWTYLFLSGLVLGAGVALAPFIPGWLKVGSGEAMSAIVAFHIAVLTVALSMVLSTFYGILQGYQKMALVNAIFYSVSLLSSFAAVGFLYLHLGVVAMALGQLVSMALGLGVAWVYARRFCPYLRLSPRYFRWARFREMLGFTGYFQMSRFAFLASSSSDNILIAGSLGPAAVTVYSLTQKLAATSTMFVNKVGGVVMPGLAELFARQETARLQAVILRLTRLLTRFGVLSLLLILALNARFVTAWVGAASYGGLALTALFAYSVFRNGVIRNLSAVFFSLGRLEGWGWLSLAEAIAKIGLTVVLLPHLGLLAPMVGTAIAELLTGVYTPLRVARLVRMPLATLLGRGIGVPLLQSLPTAGALLAANYWIPRAWGWPGMASIGLCGLLANTLIFDWTQWRQGGNTLQRMTDFELYSSANRRGGDHTV